MVISSPDTKGDYLSPLESSELLVLSSNLATIRTLAKPPKSLNWKVILPILYLFFCSGAIDAAPPGSRGEFRTLSQLPDHSIPSSSVRDIEGKSSIEIGGVKVSGSTVYSEEELSEITSRFIGMYATVETLQEITRQITQLYISGGYVTSGAYLPPQDLSDGIVKVEVVEGKLEDIEIEGLNRVRDYYVRGRLMKAVGVPLNIGRLEEALQLLQLDPLFERVEAQLNQGTEPELSVLRVKLKETAAVSVGLQFDNYESPSIGEYEGTINFAHQNLLGFGDRFSAQYSITEGQNSYELSYSLPVNADNGTVSLSYQAGDSKIIEDLFKDVGIRSNSNILSVGFRQPIILRPNEEFALSVSVDFEESRTFLLDNIPFSFTIGPENGKSRVTALRLGQDWVSRSPKRVVALRSRFSFGLGLLGATLNDSGIDADFFSWLGQFQWVEKLDHNVLLLARLAVQLSPDALLPVEQFDIGGIDTVRGYTNNLRIGDNGVAGTIEARFTLVDDESYGVLDLIPFLDFGTVWNNKLPIVYPNTLLSTGLGLSWQIDSFHVRLDYGISLIAVPQQSNSLQGNGLSFSVLWQRKF